MVDTLILIAIGAFIGWNFPQPTYAKKLQLLVGNFIRNKFANK